MEKNEKTFFIAVEGPIGIGKTTLSSLISERYDFPLLKEIVEENPFLGKFYGNQEEWSFQTEMFFLSNRYKQLEDIRKNYLSKGQSIVSDYHVFKNKIFAKRTLKEEELAKYLKIYDILIENKPEPNLVIYINASIETILKRVKRRGRDMEKNIDPNYLIQLSEDYVRFMREFIRRNPDVPVIEINGDDMDFVKNLEDLKIIFEEIDRELGIKK